MCDLGTDLGAAPTTHPQSCDHHRCNARNVKESFADDHASVGEHKREGDFGKRVVEHASDPRRDRPGKRDANKQSAERHADELEQGRAHADRFGCPSQQRQQDRKHHDRGGIVKQTLSLDQHPESLRDPQLAEDRNHGDWIGCTDQRPKHQCGQPCPSPSRTSEHNHQAGRGNGR